MSVKAKKLQLQERVDSRKEFDAWLAKYYIAEQHPLTVEALWAAWQRGAEFAQSRRQRGRKK
jgi:hypothetical protein